MPRGRVEAVFVLATCRPRVYQLVQEEERARLSTLHRGLHRRLTLVKLPHWHPGEAYRTEDHPYMLQVQSDWALC